VDTQLTEGQGVNAKEKDSAGVNRIEETKRGPGKKSRLTCYRCGRAGHISRDPNCPARGQQCRKRALEGHFQEHFKTKHEREGGKRKPKRYRGPKGGSANTVDTQEGEDDPEYAFAIGDKSKRKLKSSLVDVN